MTPLLSDRPGRCPIPPISSLCLCLQTLLSMLETVRSEERAEAADPQSASGGGPLPAEVSVKPAAAARLFRRRTVSGGRQALVSSEPESVRVGQRLFLYFV